MTTKNTNLAPEEITKKDLRKAWTRWHLANEVPHSFDRYIAASLLFALMPVLQKLYKTIYTTMHYMGYAHKDYGRHSLPM